MAIVIAIVGTVINSYICSIFLRLSHTSLKEVVSARSLKIFYAFEGIIGICWTVAILNNSFLLGYGVIMAHGYLILISAINFIISRYKVQAI